LSRGAGVGDYATPEQQIPPAGFGSVAYWETCMTMNDHWGYNKHDQDWKSTTDLVRNLIDCASKGGNYLLNVGPTAEGLIPDASVQRLHEIGQWMKINGEAIYGTQASPFRKLVWGRCTQKVDGRDTILYLHVFNWPVNGKLLVPGLQNQPDSASLLAGGKKLTARQTDQGVELEVPQNPPDAISSTIVLRISGRPEIKEMRIAPDSDGSLTMTAEDATVFGNTLGLEVMDDKMDLAFWTEPGDYVQWPIHVNRAGEYRIAAELSGEGPGEFIVETDGKKLTAGFPGTGSYHDYKIFTIGTLTLSEGDDAIIVRPVAEKWRPMNLRDVTLTPVEK
jgi:alpha-L-fucosidase